MTTPAIGSAVQEDNVSTRPFPALSRTGVIGREFPLLATQGSRMPAKAFVNSAALAKQATTIAVSDAEGDVVNIYDPAGDRLAQLTGFFSPEGLASDIKGDLYVADDGNQRVQVYAAGFKTAPTTLKDPGYFPSDVDTFNDGQIVAVCNYSTIDYGLGNVEFFTNGQLTNTVLSFQLPHILSCAFDAVGNLYVATVGPENLARVGEIVGGARGDRLSLLTTSNRIYGNSGIQVTTGGQIAVGSTSFADDTDSTIFTYNPPVGDSLGSPVSTTLLTGADFPDAFAFTKNMASLYTANMNDGEAQRFAYPAGGDALSTINVSGVPYGVAVIPTQYPKLQN